MVGRFVKTLLEKQQTGGYQSVLWDGTNSNGQFVSAGIYFYQIQAGHFVQTKKMVLLK
jgi:flagellar hook assembly protein FlgD